MKNNNLNSIYAMIICIVVGCMARILPHPDNVTPLINLSLFAGMYYTFYSASLSIIFCTLLGDIGLSILKGYPIFGVWSLFTYSFLIITVWAGMLLPHTRKIILISVPAASLGYWLWTNLGVWLLYDYYPKSLDGLLLCYQLALPFLKNSLTGDLLWMIIIFGFGTKLLLTKETPGKSISFPNSKSMAPYLKLS